MDNWEAIDRRIARRAYRGVPLSDTDCAALRAHIDRINAETGLTITLLFDGRDAFDSFGKSYGMFSGVRSLIVLKGWKSDENLKEKLGYHGEIVVLEATKLGLGTCWVGGTFDRESDLFARDEDEQLVCVITIGNVAPTESFKEKTIRSLIHRKTKRIEEMCVVDTDVPPWFMTAMEAVQKAPSTRNTQKVVFTYAKGEVSAAVPDTYPLDRVDLGIAKLHFEYAAGNGHFDVGNQGVFHRLP